MAPRKGGDGIGECLADARSGDLAPVYALMGAEAALSRQAFDALFAASVAGGPRGFNEQIWSGEKVTGADIASAAATMPMMGPRRTLVVRSANKMKKEARDALAVALASPSPTSVILLLAEDGSNKLCDGREKLPKAIKKVGRWCEFRKLYGRQLREWMEGEARRLGKRLGPGCAAFLEDLVGNDLGQLGNGLNVAALYVGEADTIRLEDLEYVVSGHKQEALWDMLDGLAERSHRSVLTNLQRLWTQGEGPFGVLNLARRRVGQLLAAEVAMADGANRRDALAAAGVPPNMTWKWEKQLGHYRPQELLAARDRLLEAESDVKGGRRIDSRWAVERALLDIVAR